MVQVTTPTSLAIDSPHGRKLFVFDRVFGEDVDQQGVWDYLQESVEAFCQGYNVSVLAYGQSGAGKSYTMGTSGPEEQNDVRVMGVIPRAARILFEKLQRPDPTSRQSSGLRQPTQRFSQVVSPSRKQQADKDWIMRATYVEIYQEQLRDLLVPESVPMQDRPTIQIREDPKGRILLTGLHQVEINSIDDLLRALNSGSSIRQTDATAINARSSRSHAVFCLNLIQKKHGIDGNGSSVRDKRMSVPVDVLSGTESYITVDSKLHFVDLAGSERLKNTQAQGERAREGISINAGLASLGKVIAQLSSRSAGSHVSYRDSKLTRLLQDSLGGNAITYMIACVTPAEFHLSETLNTVQYAQRARAIQSKPRIQQVDEEGNRQAVIDRLRAEVSFLREQIKQAQGGDRRSQAHADRPDHRSNEREMGLQHQLLDIQENYGALSQRHARLIADVARLRESPGDQSPVDGAPQETPAERTKRSIAFAETVEQVVLEYEKTIQSLEGLLSNTRTSLATTDANLLERESKLTYAETMNAQLQTRIQKIIDRETNNEAYLHQLEQQLDGHHSGEDRNTTILNQLRKELTRIRDNEANAEDYISTLEERLAESDQDAELMQREIDRLGHVVERQRSLGKLDNLLFELDHISHEGAQVNGSNKAVAKANLGSSQSNRMLAPVRDLLHRTPTDASVQTNASFRSAADSLTISSNGSEAEAMPGSFVEETDPTTPTAAMHSRENLAKSESPHISKQSPEQSAFVADKLEAVTQELFDLRIEHESASKDHQATASELELVQIKYEGAMRAMAEFQEVVEEARQTPRALSSDSLSNGGGAFFAGAGMMKARSVVPGGHPPSSQSLSSELFLAGESSSSIDTLGSGTMGPSRDTSQGSMAHTHDQAAELEAMRELHLQREAQLKELAAHHEALQQEHSDTLDVVEELKTEIAKASVFKGPSSPREPIIRRTSAQSNGNLDKAHRSFAAIKRIIGDKLEKDGDVDAMQNLELNLNTAMHELHARQDKIQALENDVTTTRREMESKTQLITGLTRERTSLSASPIDISVMSNFRDQLAASETQYKMLQASTAQRETELLAQVATMKAAINSSGRGAAKQASDMVSLHQKQNELQDHQVGQLQEQLALAEKRHQAVVEAKHESDKKLMVTITELEAAMTHVENLRRDASNRSLEAMAQPSIPEDSEAEKVQHQRSISRLETELAYHKATANSTTQKVNGLVSSHAAAKDQVREATQAKVQADADLTSLEALVHSLESQLAEHQARRENHEQAVKGLQEHHEHELRRTKDELYEEHRARLADHSARHQEAIRDVNQQLSESREAMNEMQENLLKAEAALHERETLIEQLQATILDHKTKAAQSEEIGRALQKEVETTKSQGDQHQSTIAELQQLHEKSLAEVTALHRRDQERSRIVEELEMELSSTFDQHEGVRGKLAALQTERANFLEEEQRKDQMLENSRAEIAELQARLEGSPVENLSRSRANSMARKSAPSISLPSPPPNAPLPPLPSTGLNSRGSPTMTSPLSSAIAGMSTHSRRPSRDLSLERADHKSKVEDFENRIRVVERNLYAEKSLVTTLEEALEELERSSKRSEADRDHWKKQVWSLEEENNQLKARERDRTVRESQQSTLTQSTIRQSLIGGGGGGAGGMGSTGMKGMNGMASTSGRESWSPNMGMGGAEAAQREEKAQKVQRDLESRMNALNQKKNKKKSSLACF